MKTTYAVKWREPDGQRYVGRLTLTSKALRLEGRAGDGSTVERQVGYDELREVRVGQVGADRLDGRPTLVLVRADGSYSVASAVMGAGILHELVDRVSELRLASPRRATVVLPLKEGALERARELVAGGPPFDPAETSLARHCVWLTSQEAIFVFEAQSEGGLEALLGMLDVWAAAVAWRDLVAGPPRLAEVAYGWERPEPGIVPAVGLGF